MKTFEYRGYSVQGKKCKGIVEAAHAKAAREKLAADGILAETLAESGSGGGRVSEELRGIIYRELAALLDAGMPLVTALDTLINNPEMRESAAILAMVRDSVRDGGKLADALAASRIRISDFEEATIAVAERTATLDKVLVQLADFIDERQRIKDRISQALLYPALVLVLGIVVAIVMLVFLLPRTQKVMAGSGVAMPWITKIMLAFGNALWPWGLAATAALAAVLTFVLRRIRRDPVRRIKYNARMLHLPLLGSNYRLLTAVRFSRTLAILVRAGVPLVQGVVLAGSASGSSLVEKLAGEAGEKLRHGSTLAAAVREMPPLCGLLAGWVDVGEAGGSLAQMLEYAAERCRAQFDRRLARQLVLLEPLMLLLVGGFVLLIVLAVLLPMFSLSSAIAH